MSQCKVCNKNHSRFIMANHPVCLSCDELLFDMEIECDDVKETIQKGDGTTNSTTVGTSTTNA